MHAYSYMTCSYRHFNGSIAIMHCGTELGYSAFNCISYIQLCDSKHCDDTHTGTHTHARTHARTCTHQHARTHTHTPRHACSHSHMLRCTTNSLAVIYIYIELHVRAIEQL